MDLAKLNIKEAIPVQQKDGKQVYMQNIPWAPNAGSVSGVRFTGTPVDIVTPYRDTKIVGARVAVVLANFPEKIPTISQGAELAPNDPSSNPYGTSIFQRLSTIPYRGNTVIVSGEFVPLFLDFPITQWYTCTIWGDGYYENVVASNFYPPLAANCYGSLSLYYTT